VGRRDETISADSAARRVAKIKKYEYETLESNINPSSGESGDLFPMQEQLK
jgi:hypothetical protein